jgi:hypothetical protein
MVKLVKRNSIKQAGLLVAAAMILLLTGSSAFAFNFDVKGTDVTIGGAIKAMLTYDINNLNDNTNAPYQGDIFNPYTVVLDNDPSKKDKKDDFRFIGRESKLFVKTSSKFDTSVIGTHIEGDFYGTSDVNGGGGYETWSNQYSFRIRHAYGTITEGNQTLLVGQTWTTFMDLPGLTPVMDFNGDIGSTFARQAMVRYTYNFAKANNIAIALENPDRGFIGAPSGTPAANFINAGTPETKYPDLIVKYWFGGGWGHIAPSFVVQQYKLNDEEATSFGAQINGHLNISKHKLYFGGMYGDGLGRYGGLGVLSGVGLTATGDIELVPFWGVYLGTKLHITDAWKLIVGAGYSKTDKDAYEGSDAVLTRNANETTRSFRTFFTYNPNPVVEYALGVVYGDREVMDGRKGDGTRVQGYVQFGF